MNFSTIFLFIEMHLYIFVYVFVFLLCTYSHYSWCKSNKLRTSQAACRALFLRVVTYSPPWFFVLHDNAPIAGRKEYECTPPHGRYLTNQRLQWHRFFFFTNKDHTIGRMNVSVIICNVIQDCFELILWKYGVGVCVCVDDGWLNLLHPAQVRLTGQWCWVRLHHCCTLNNKMCTY